MTPLGWVKLGLSLLLKLISFLQERKLLAAGEATAIVNGLKIADQEVDNAMQAREDFKAARERGDIGPDDDDGYRRD